jgi:hypothetical protein
VAPPEAWHEVGAPGEPVFLNSWINPPPVESALETVGFYKDHEGTVHLKGIAVGGKSEAAFMLPPGFRPASGKNLAFPVTCSGGSLCVDGVSRVVILGSGLGIYDGEVEVPVGANTVSFNGIAFRAES